MKRAIYKFQLPMNDEITLRGPRVLRWLGVAVQHDQPCVWAVVDPDTPRQSNKLVLRGTGHALNGEEGKFLGSFMLHSGSFVGHVFEKVPKAEEPCD
jgi:hypothetical protein